MTEFTQSLGRLVLELCPAGQRELLRQNLANLGKVSLAAAQTQAVGHREIGRDQGGVSQEEARRHRRFSLLVDRLKRNSGAAIPTQEDVADAGASLREKVIAASAVSARSENEFQKYRH